MMSVLKARINGFLAERDGAIFNFKSLFQNSLVSFNHVEKD